MQADELQPIIGTYRYRSDCVRYGTKVDYAIRGFRVFEDEKNNYISGERYLNYCCLRFIYGHTKSSFVQVLYYLYLLVRHHFNKEFIQANNKTGFQNFKEYNDRKSELIKGTSYEKMANVLVLQTLPLHGAGDGVIERIRGFFE